MKSKTGVFLFILLIVAFVSCEKESVYKPHEPQLKIKEANIIFDTTGGDGFIELVAPGSITATSNEEWCQVSVSGTTVNLTATSNKSMGGRTATITINSLDESISITAIQTASLFWFKDFKSSSLALMSEGGTIATEVRSTHPVTVVSKPDWLSYKFTNDSLYLTAEASIPRKGSITFISNDRTMTFDIMQFSYAGLLGEWQLDFKNPSNSNKEETEIITFEEKTKNESFWLKGLTITGSNKAEIEVRFNSNSNNLSIDAGQYLMQATDGRYVFLSLRSDAGKYNWGETLTGKLDIADDGKVTYSFRDEGNWDGIGFYLFTGDTPSSSTSTGSSYRRLMHLVMTKK